MRPTVAMLTVLVFAAASGQVAAQAAPVPGSLHACVSVTADKERLACFDREMAKLDSAQTNQAAAAVAPAPRVAAAASAPTAAPTPSPPPAANTTPPPVKQLAPEQAFGLSGNQARALEARQQGVPLPARLKNITAQIASASLNSEGHWVITLDNGQVWRQSETRSFEATPGATVKISSGSMGSFWIETNRHNWTRVDRVM